MNLHFGFSYIGLLFLLMLTAPNLLWTKRKPEQYERYVKNENKILRALERTGEALTVCLSLSFSDFNPTSVSSWNAVLLAAFFFLILYEINWIRYFKSGRTMKDFYRSLLGIPVAGATLPVIAFLLLSLYGKNVFLAVAVVILGIGHIGIHLGHRREAEKEAAQGLGKSGSLTS